MRASDRWDAGAVAAVGVVDRAPAGGAASGEAASGEVAGGEVVAGESADGEPVAGAVRGGEAAAGGGAAGESAGGERSDGNSGRALTGGIAERAADGGPIAGAAGGHGAAGAPMSLGGGGAAAGGEWAAALLAQAARSVAAGDDGAARAACLAVLRAEPTHLGALLELASLALRGGYRSAARTALEQARHWHPRAAAVRVNLGTLLLAEGEVAAARAEFVAALAVDAELPEAHQGLARCLAALGEAGAAPHRARGFAGGAVAPQRYRGQGAGVGLLLLVAAEDGNIATRRLIDDTLFAVTAVYPEHLAAGAVLPGAALVFNAIADADLCGPALAAARRLLAGCRVPVLNPPERVALTGRAANAARLARVPGVVAPKTRLLPRAALLRAAEDGAAEAGAAAQSAARQGSALAAAAQGSGVHEGVPPQAARRRRAGQGWSGAGGASPGPASPGGLEVADRWRAGTSLAGVSAAAGLKVGTGAGRGAGTGAGLGAGLAGVAGCGLRSGRVAAGAATTAEAAAGLGQGLPFPLLLRAPGFHTGQHFVRVESAAELPAAVAALPGEALLAISYLDARGADGMARKYRVMCVDGRLYPLHLAISPDWKVHYYRAAMAVPAHRAEERRFLEDMPGVLGPRAMAALTEIAAVLELDYAGIDFGLAADGSVLLFEANAAMVVHPPDPDPIWDYRRPAIDAVLAAVHAMLRRRAAENVLPICPGLPDSSCHAAVSDAPAMDPGHGQAAPNLLPIHHI